MVVWNRVAVAVLVAMLVTAGCGESVSQQPTDLSVHRCAGAGRWFPASAGKLRADVEKYLAEAEPFESDTQIVGLIAPHAGYAYSGPVAGYAYRAVQGRPYTRVVAMAPSHWGIPSRGVSVGLYSAFQTPLGDIPVDEKACRLLLDDPSGLFQHVPAAHTTEHSLENHLPFLQVALGEFKLVPLMFGGLRDDDYVTVASSLDKFLDDETLFVVSTDFTHYGGAYRYTPFPLDGKTPDRLEALANLAFGFMKRPDPSGFRGHLAETRDTICGWVPVTVLLEVLENRAAGHMLKFDTSGRMSGDYSFSVSYASVVFTRETEISDAKTTVGDNPSSESDGNKEPTAEPGREAAGEYRELTDVEQATLLKLARRSLESHFGLADKPTVPSAEFPVTSLLEKSLGVFVTLKKNGDLRGCIGNVQEGRTPLYQLVQEFVVHSAIRDRRFRPMTKDEVDDVHIEISVMRHVDGPRSPFKPCSDVRKIVVGRDGLLVERAPRYRGILLPQVPLEQKWNLEQYLDGICRKAGLPRTALDDPETKLYTFSAQVFGE